MVAQGVPVLPGASKGQSLEVSSVVPDAGIEPRALARINMTAKGRAGSPRCI
jgi:hypothetical protein